MLGLQERRKFREPSLARLDTELGFGRKPSAKDLTDEQRGGGESRPRRGGAESAGKFPHRLPPAKKIVKIAFDEFTKDYSLATPTATAPEIEALTQQLRASQTV